MNKIRLDLDALAVESFDTAHTGGEEGTVEAYGTYKENTCFGNSCRRETQCNACPTAGCNSEMTNCVQLCG